MVSIEENRSILSWQIYLICLVALLLISCRHTVGEAESIIREQTQLFSHAYQQHDIATIITLYHPQASLLPAHRPPVEGRQAIEHFWHGFRQLAIETMRLTSVTISSGDTIAHEDGHYQLQLTDGTVIDRGKYLIVWHKWNGEWLIYRQMWTTSQLSGAEQAA